MTPSDPDSRPATRLTPEQQLLRATVERALRLGVLERAPDAICLDASPLEVAAALRFVQARLDEHAIAAPGDARHG